MNDSEHFFYRRVSSTAILQVRYSFFLKKFPSSIKICLPGSLRHGQFFPQLKKYDLKIGYTYVPNVTLDRQLVGTLRRGYGAECLDFINGDELDPRSDHKDVVGYSQA